MISDRDKSNKKSPCILRSVFYYIHVRYKCLIEFRLFNAFITDTTNTTVHYSAVAGLVVSSVEVGDSKPTATALCPLARHLTPRKRKGWLCPDMTEKWLSGTLKPNPNKQTHTLVQFRPLTDQKSGNSMMYM